MKRFAILISILVVWAMASASAAAGCPPNASCIVIPVGRTGGQVEELLEASWNGGDFECSLGGSLHIIGETGERKITVIVPGGTTALVHTLDIRAFVPISFPFLPFDLFADFDGAGEVELDDTATQFGEITLDVETVSGGFSPTFGPSALDRSHTAMLVFGLLAAGAVFVVLRRT